jgi:Tfp pilus assembly protein PilO
MKSIFDKLNLGALERRIVVGAMLVLFVVVNAMFVWPHFQDWNKVQLEIAKAQKLLADYQKEVDQLPKLEKKETELKGVGGAQLASSEMALALMRTVDAKASASGIVVVNRIPGQSGGQNANSYFDEQTLRISFQNTGDAELVKFMVSLGENNSTIRIRDLTVKPDPSQMKLMGELTMVASYQKPAPVVKQSSPATPKRP